jgi:hypothetical protein
MCFSRVVPRSCHADYIILHGTFYGLRIIQFLLRLLARPKRFELLTQVRSRRFNPLGHDSFDNRPDGPLIMGLNLQPMGILAGLTSP